MAIELEFFRDKKRVLQRVEYLISPKITPLIW
jgi:hypothetical protein